ncbi:right-handed parallel beta-helix repeat-containing protein [Natrialbaceae archaeon A-arb3/5]
MGRRHLLAAGSVAFLLVKGGCTSPNGTGQVRYYISGETGSDTHGNGTKDDPWRTLEPITDRSLGSGSTIYLEGTSSYEGPIVVNGSTEPGDQGTADEPITFTSYGGGRATINVSSGNGFKGHNARGVVITDLDFVGPGPESADSSGICFVASDEKSDASSTEHIVIDEVGVGGFTDGISFVGTETHGYDNVTVRHAEVYNNVNGITFRGKTRETHQNVTVERCHVHHNPGRDDSDTHTGSGILINGTTDGLVDNCVAHSNGDPGWGNIGIWCYGAKRVVIQRCESFSNQSSTEADGGGFDIDGGSVECIIQNCYSHDNDGAGFLWAQYEGATTEYGPIEECVMRYNVSENDARANDYGAMTFWGATETDYIDESVAHNNTLYIDGTEDADQAAVEVRNTNIRNVCLANNLFVATGDAVLIRDEEGVSPNETRFWNNGYYATGSRAVEQNGSAYSTVDSWLAANSQQERGDGMRLSTVADPKFADPGSGGHIFDGNIKNFDVTSLDAYELLADSPMIDAGFRLGKLFDAHRKPMFFDKQELTDFRGTPVPHGEQYDIGAYESQVSPK